MLPAEFDSPVSGQGERIRTCRSQNPGWSLPNGSPTHSAGPCDRSRVRASATTSTVATGRQREGKEVGIERLAGRCVAVVADKEVADDFARAGDLASRRTPPTAVRQCRVEKLQRPPECPCKRRSSRTPNDRTARRPITQAPTNGPDRRPASRGRGARLATGPAPRVPPAWLAAPEEPPEANRQRAVDGDGQSGRP